MDNEPNMIDINKYSSLLEAIHLALVHIRASDSLDECKIVAHIFHNVPLGIKNGRASENVEDKARRLAEYSGRPDLARFLNVTKT